MEQAQAPAPAKGQEATQAKTPQQLHQKAAEHHEQASKYHKEAAKQHEAGDEKTAAQHALIARGHTVQATEQEREVSKKYAETHNPQTSQTPQSTQNPQKK